MELYDKYYHKVKYILLEFNNTKNLDSYYMSKYLSESNNSLNLSNNELVNNYNAKILENEELQINKNINSELSKMFYKPLAKLLHPDKNNNESDDFIKLNKAYMNNDYLTLFLFYYEKKIKINLASNIIEILDNEIQNKENEINSIKNKIHWKWNLSNSQEKELIEQYIKSQL